jgi:uncharacterized protein (DUF952 family)
MRPTYHLVPADVWAGAVDTEPYTAESLATEGFIHCTDGVGPLAVTFDRHYAAGQRSFLALTIDLDALTVPWRHDVPGTPYPHIYGPVDRVAIIGVEHVRRGREGEFSGLDPA